MRAVSPRATSAAGHDDRHRRRVDGEDGPEQDLLGRAIDGVGRRVEVQEEGRTPGGGAEHDAGRHIAAAHALHANGVHAQCAQDAAGQKAGQRAEAEQQRARAPGRGDVRQGVPGEGLAADDGEDPDGGGDDGDHAPDDDGGVHRRAGEEPRLEKPPHAAQRPSCKGSIGMTAPASWPGPATTMTRPWTLRTST